MARNYLQPLGGPDPDVRPKNYLSHWGGDFETTSLDEDDSGIGLLTPLSEFRKGLWSSLTAGNIEMLGGAAEAFAAESGEDPATSVGRRVQDWINDPARRPDAPMTWEEASGPWGVASYLAGLTGQGIGSMAAPVAAGAAGAAAGSTLGPLGTATGAIGGAVTAGSLMNIGETYLQLRNEGIEPKQAAQWALPVGAGIGAIDAFGLSRLLGATVAKDVKGAAISAFAREAAKGYARGAGEEGLTEMAQSAVREGLAASLTGNPDMERRALSLLEEGLAGALAGGAIGGVGRGARAVAGSRRPTLTERRPTTSRPDLLDGDGSQLDELTAEGTKLIDNLLGDEDSSAELGDRGLPAVGEEVVYKTSTGEQRGKVTGFVPADTVGSETLSEVLVITDQDGVDIELELPLQPGESLQVIEEADRQESLDRFVEDVSNLVRTTEQEQVLAKLREEAGATTLKAIPEDRRQQFMSDLQSRIDEATKATADKQATADDDLLFEEDVSDIRDDFPAGTDFDEAAATVREKMELLDEDIPAPRRKLYLKLLKKEKARAAKAAAAAERAKKGTLNVREAIRTEGDGAPAAPDWKPSTVMVGGQDTGELRVHPDGRTEARMAGQDAVQEFPTQREAREWLREQTLGEPSAPGEAGGLEQTLGELLAANTGTTKTLSGLFDGKTTEQRTEIADQLAQLITEGRLPAGVQVINASTATRGPENRLFRTSDGAAMFYALRFAAEEASPARTAPARERPADAEPYVPSVGQTDQVVLPDGTSYDTRYEVVDASDLITSNVLTGQEVRARDPRYPAELQPRDISKVEEREKIRAIAQAPDPRRLGLSQAADIGAPLVGEDGVVESGNGRVLGISIGYARGTADTYRHMLDQISDTTGMERPVLIRRRIGELPAAERLKLTREANRSTAARLSTVDQAMADAQALGDQFARAYVAGGLTSGQNAELAKAFFRSSAVSVSERNELLNEAGELSPAGVARMQAAIVARAYGSRQLVSHLTADTEPDRKSVRNAMVDIAPAWAKMREGLSADTADQDVTEALTDAVALISRSVSDDAPIQNLFMQQSLIADPMLEGDRAERAKAVLQWFYSENPFTKQEGVKTRLASQPQMQENLQRWVAAVERFDPKQETMFGPLEPPVVRLMRGDFSPEAVKGGTLWSDAQPTGDKPPWYVSEEAAAGETAPAASETIPAAGETIPAAGETIPAAGETIPEPPAEPAGTGLKLNREKGLGWVVDIPPALIDAAKRLMNADPSSFGHVGIPREDGGYRATEMQSREARRLYSLLQDPGGQAPAEQAGGLSFGKKERIDGRDTVNVIRDGKRIGEIRRTKGGADNPGWWWTLNVPGLPEGTERNHETVRAAKLALTAAVGAETAPTGGRAPSRDAEPPADRSAQLRAAGRRATAGNQTARKTTAKNRAERTRLRSELDNLEQQLEEIDAELGSAELGQGRELEARREQIEDEQIQLYEELSGLPEDPDIDQPAVEVRGERGEWRKPTDEEYSALRARVHEAAARIAPSASIETAPVGALASSKGVRARATYISRSLEARIDPRVRPGVIRIAMFATQPEGALRHEAIHAMRDMGLFTDPEWTALVQAEKRGKWGEKHRIAQFAAYADPNIQTEEAIAFEFEHWWRARAATDAQLAEKPSDSLVTRLFKRMGRFLADVRTRLAEYALPERRVFRMVESGEIGKRTPDTLASVRRRGARLKDAAGQELLAVAEPPGYAFADPDAEKAYGRGKAQVTRATAMDFVQEKSAEIYESFKRIHKHLPQNRHWARAHDWLRELKEAPQIADEKVGAQLQRVVGDLDVREYDLVSRAVFVSSLAQDVKLKKDIPIFGSHDKWKTEWRRLQAEIKKPANKRVGLRLRLRKAHNRQLAQGLVDADVIPRESLEDRDYITHRVLEYEQEQKGLGVLADIKTPKTKRRKGTKLDISTRFLETEALWMKKAFVDIKIADTIGKFKKADYNQRRKLLNAVNAENRGQMDGRIMAETAPILQAKGVDTTFASFREITTWLANVDTESPARASELRQALSTSPLYAGMNGFRVRLAIGFSGLHTSLQDISRAEIPARFAAAFDSLGNPDPDVPPWRFLEWLAEGNLNHVNPALTVKAQGIFKALADRRSFMRGTLAGDWLSTERLDKALRVMVRRGHEEWKGKRTWQPDEGSLMFSAETLTERVMNATHAHLAEIIAEEPKVKALIEPGLRDEVSGVLRGATLMGGPKYQLVVDDELGETLKEFRDEHLTSQVNTVMRAVISGWKTMMTVFPTKVIKYNIRNVSGDVDHVNSAMGWRALKPTDIGQAWRELWDVQMNQGEPSADYEIAREKAVLNGGYSLELFMESKQDVDRSLSEIEPGAKKTALSTLNRAWGWTTRVNGIREDVLRLVVFRKMRERIRATFDGDKLPAVTPERVDEVFAGIGYGPTLKEIMRGLDDWDSVAAYYSRDVLGDYGHLTRAGRQIRASVYPFWSWQEINAKFYRRTFANVVGQWRESGKVTPEVSAAMARAGWMTGKLGAAFLVARAFQWFAFQYAWNHLLWPEEEDELTDTDQRRGHLIIGKWDDEILMLPTPGALTELTRWIGAEDALGAMEHVAAGRGDWGDVVEAVASGFINTVAQGLNPVYKMAVEQMMAVETFPDVLHPRRMRSRTQHVIRGVGLNVVTDLFGALTNTGRPTQGAYHIFANLLVDKRPADYAAYSQIRSVAYQFKSHMQGEKTFLGSMQPREEAYWNYRLALRFEDDKAAARWRTRMRDLGISIADRREMLERAKPLGMLTRGQQRLFRKTLTPEDRRVLAQAETYWQGTFAGR